MNKDTLDVLVFIPVIPAVPILVTWWLPWERWLPKKLPKAVLGPYILYLSFAAWYFKMSWWVVLMAVIFGVVVTGMAVYEAGQNR